MNNFMQNAAYATPLIRAFDSYTSSDGGDTWTAPSSGTPQLPPSSYASVPGGDVPLFKLGSTTTYATDVKDVLNSSTTNILWELDGYSAYTNGSLDTSGTGGIPDVWTQADYSATGVQFNGYTQGPGYYGKTFFLWPPDPRNGAITSARPRSRLISPPWELAIRRTQTTLANNWSHLLGQGMTTGLANLQSWLTGEHDEWGSLHYDQQVCHRQQQQSTDILCRLPALQPGLSGGCPAMAIFRGLADRASSARTTIRSCSTRAESWTCPRSGPYTINYNAILSWIAQSPNPFPTQLQGGRVKYYGSIPTAITGSWPSYGSTDQQFWVEFIDHVLGFRQTASGVYTDISNMVGYGRRFQLGDRLDRALLQARNRSI